MSAIGMMTSILGVICGIAGFEHGFFEMLQGNVVPASQNINAIGESNRFWQYGTEPAFTVIPNFLITGILAMTISLLVIIWAVWFVQRNKFGAPIFILLSILQYLVGGGIPHAGLAILIGIPAFWINRPLAWGWSALPTGFRQVLAMPWLMLVFALAIVFCMTIVGAIFGVLPGVTDPKMVTQLLFVLLYAMEGIVPLMIISVFAHDSLRKVEKYHA